MTPTLRIIKVGGSLLDFERLPQSLFDWIATQPPASNLLIAGGGSLADVIRSWDKRFSLGEAASHAICLELLRATARILAARLETRSRKSVPVISWNNGDIDSAWGNAVGEIAVLDAGQVVLDFPNLFDAAPIPASWNVTSDSVAARIASVLRANELVLMKSVSAAAGESVERLVQRGAVDEYFPTAIERLPQVRWLNLRAFAAKKDGAIRELVAVTISKGS